MSQLELQKKEKVRKRDNWFVDFFAEFSFSLVAEVLVGIILRAVLFIPRMIIRSISNIF